MDIYTTYAYAYAYMNTYAYAYVADVFIFAGNPFPRKAFHRAFGCACFDKAGA